MQWLLKMFDSNRFFTISLILSLTLGVLSAISDPYKLLGLTRSATLPEIRRAYKQLAKEWHPDKTNNPAAESRFVEIKQAYEILSDPERKRMYDNHGITDEDSVSKKQDYSFYGRFNTDPLDELFASHGGRFHFQDQDITIFHKMSVTTRHFENNLIPKSYHTPHLLLVYADWCFPCLQVAGIWRRLIETLEPLGIGVGTVHAGREPGLARKLATSTGVLPHLVLLLDGHHYVYSEPLHSVQRVVEFIRSKMPYRLVKCVTDDTLEEFLSGWPDNRVRALVFERRASPRLRYLVAAFHYRHRVAFGFVNLNAAQTHKTQQRYKTSPNLDTLLLFTEDSQQPQASVSMSDIPYATLHHVIGTNQYLVLPRLSSQAVFEALCPAEWNRPRRRLCVVLITGGIAQHEQELREFRQYVLDKWWKQGNEDRVRFVYVDGGSQRQFVEQLSEGMAETVEGDRKGPDADSDPTLRLVAVWRRDTNQLRYEWIPGCQWRATRPPSSASNETRRRLEEAISRLLRGSQPLAYETVVQDLLDEHAQGLFSRILTKLLIAIDIVYESLTKDQLLPILSIVATIIFIVAAGYFMAYLVRLEEVSVQQQRNAKRNGNNNNETESVKPQPRELHLHELRAEKYNGLVRLLKPGCRTIILFVDMQSRMQLIPAFHKIVWPYRKNKTLLFAYMCVERGLSWYAELLRLSLPDPSASPHLQQRINPRNCVGTVLSLNGHRKYFCMFHAKHAEVPLNKNKQKKQVKRMSEDPELGAFIGFNTDSSSDEDCEPGAGVDDGAEEVLLQGHLLDNLPNWLDRLFEGTTRRYYINYWPDFPTK